MTRPLFTLLTDFGTRDPYLAEVKGVLLSRCPGAELVDIAHDLAPHDILSGAFLLGASARWFPRGTVHLAVVDPGVGTARRAIAAAGGGQMFVGPDNGLFTLLYGRAEITETREIDPVRCGLGPISPTFHGRDIFAPVAARLAGGAPLAGIGPEVTDPVRLPLEPPRIEGDAVRCHVLHIDRFGNVTTTLTPPVLDELLRSAGALGLDLPRPEWRPTPLVTAYGEGPRGRPFLLWGSSGYLEIAADRQAASQMLGLASGDLLSLALRRT